MRNLKCPVCGKGMLFDHQNRQTGQIRVWCEDTPYHVHVTGPGMDAVTRAVNAMREPAERRCGTCANGTAGGEYNQVRCGALPMLSDAAHSGRMRFGDTGNQCALWRERSEG